MRTRGNGYMYLNIINTFVKLNLISNTIFPLNVFYLFFCFRFLPVLFNHSTNANGMVYAQFEQILYSIERNSHSNDLWDLILD